MKCRAVNNRRFIYAFLGDFVVVRLHLFAFFSATDNAMATACLCGRPALVSVRMFSDMALRLHPWIIGMLFFLGLYILYFIMRIY